MHTYHALSMNELCVYYKSYVDVFGIAGCSSHSRSQPTSRQSLSHPNAGVGRLGRVE